MYKMTLAMVCTAATVLVATISFGVYGVHEEGMWPNSWPEELESFRAQSRTFTHDSGVIHEIPFTNREEFETAWPHILTLLSKGVALELPASPHNVFGTMKAGVLIPTPWTGQLISPDGTVHPTAAESGIPADNFLLPSDRSIIDKRLKERPGKIEVIVDGEIVDWENISRRASTPRLNKGGKTKHNKHPVVPRRRAHDRCAVRH